RHEAVANDRDAKLKGFRNHLLKSSGAEAQAGKLSTASQSFARLAFGEAADRYVASRTLELAPSSLAKERQLLIKPREFFQATSLNRISAERILAYREWRSAQGVGPTILNMEVGVLRRI